MCIKHLWIKHTNRSGKFDSAKLLIKRWQSKPSGFNINAQLIFPARNVTGLMCCSVTWCQVIHRKTQVNILFKWFHYPVNPVLFNPEEESFNYKSNQLLKPDKPNNSLADCPRHCINAGPIGTVQPAEVILFIWLNVTLQQRIFHLLVQSRCASDWS